MKNILVIRFSSLGDTVLTTGVLKYLKASIPDLNINVLTSDQFEDIFKNQPFISSVYSVKRHINLKELKTFAKSLPEFDVVFDLHDNLRSHTIKKTLNAKTYTYDKNSISRRLFVKFRFCKNNLRKHTVEKYFYPFSQAFKIKEPDIELLRPSLPVFENTIKDANTIVIHPFASKKCKEWPYIFDLCSKLIYNNFKVIIVGNGEIDLPEGVIDKTGLIPFDDLKKYIAKGSLFITTDSGPMHIAIAMNIATIAIFGPTTKELGFYPLFKNTWVIENNNLKCRPCHIHGPNACPKKNFLCMKSLSSELVFDLLMEKLNNKETK